MFEQDSHARKIAADVTGAAAGTGTATVLAPAIGPIPAAMAGAAVAYGVKEVVKDDKKLASVVGVTERTPDGGTDAPLGFKILKMFTG